MPGDTKASYVVAKKRSIAIARYPYASPIHK